MIRLGPFALVWKDSWTGRHGLALDWRPDRVGRNLFRLRI